ESLAELEQIVKVVTLFEKKYDIDEFSFLIDSLEKYRIFKIVDTDEYSTNEALDSITKSN
ncbi:hypothetical protein FWK35_00015698, partial [Aphis craccivora]